MEAKSYLLSFIAILVWFEVGVSCAQANASSNEPKYKIAILDTGYDIHAPGTKLKLCKTGHFDFRSYRRTIDYTQSHGTEVSSIIAERLKDVDYCAIIYQIESVFGTFPDQNIIGALELANVAGVVAVNMSFVSSDPSIAEREALKRIASKGAKLFVAAGNDRKNLDYECDVFPACYDIPNLSAVGALDPLTGEKASYSNRGSRIKLWYSGRYHAAGRSVNGTSLAVPRALSEYVLSLDQ